MIQQQLRIPNLIWEICHENEAEIALQIYPFFTTSSEEKNTRSKILIYEELQRSKQELY